VNYGLWYDDVQMARVAVEHAEIAKRLKVKKIIIGELRACPQGLDGHRRPGAHRRLEHSRESALVLLDQIVSSGSSTLILPGTIFRSPFHDPCNIVRAMGIVEPQRRILRKIAPRFREMTPHGRG